MNCWRVQNLVAPFVDGALGQEEQQQINEHLDNCSQCRELVEGVAGLPDLPFPALSPALEGAIFAGFEEQLAARIQSSMVAGVDIYGHSEELDPGLTLGQSGPAKPAAPRSSALLMASVAALLLLTAGVIWNHRQVERLEEAVAQRDEVIQVLQRRLIALDLEQQGDYDLRRAGLTEPRPVFLPAAAPQALPVPMSNGFSSQRTGFGQGSPYQQVSLDGMRVIH